MSHPDQVASLIAAQDELAERVRASKTINERRVDRHFARNAGKLGRIMRGRERSVELVDAARKLDPPKAPIERLKVLNAEVQTFKASELNSEDDFTEVVKYVTDASQDALLFALFLCLKKHISLVLRAMIHITLTYNN